MNTPMRLFSALFLSTLAAVSLAEVAVIVHPDATITASRSAVTNIYLGLDRSATPVDLQGWPAAREQFYRELLRQNEGQFKSYWAGRIFTGKGRPPRALADQAAVLEHVATHRHALGYVDSTVVDERVRVLFLLQ